MNLEMSASLSHEVLVRELNIDIQNNLESEFDPDQCCIYRVLKDIRRGNEEAYTPKLISIGPFHHGKEELANMEKTKRRYMKSFFQRESTIKKQDEILSFIEHNEKQIRNCYAETSELESLKYVMMILYDAIFIIELFLRNRNPGDTSDSFLSTAAVRYSLTSDLELLENQLPFFVLEGIWMLAFDGFCMPTFMEISQFFFSFFINFHLITPLLPVKHFTDWRRYTLMESYPKSGQRNGWIRDLPCATKLNAFGVKFKHKGENKLLQFEKRKRELQLPRLLVDNRTECLLRNIIALEQCHYSQDTHVCNYVKLMSFLMDTEKDVDLLVAEKIISKDTYDNATIANMFNKLCRCTTLSPSSYYDMCEQLQIHYHQWWNNTKAALRSTITLGAVVLLLLTIIQTICSILQVV